MPRFDNGSFRRLYHDDCVRAEFDLLPRRVRRVRIKEKEEVEMNAEWFREIMGAPVKTLKAAQLW